MRFLMGEVPLQRVRCTKWLTPKILEELCAGLLLGRYRARGDHHTTWLCLNRCVLFGNIASPWEYCASLGILRLPRNVASPAREARERPSHHVAGLERICAVRSAADHHRGLGISSRKQHKNTHSIVNFRNNSQGIVNLK